MFYFKITLILFLAAIMACAKETGTQSLSISVTKLGFILPGKITFPSTDICYTGASILEPRYFLPKITTTWQGDGTFLPVIVKLEISDSGNMSENVCTLSSGSTSASLAYALGFDSGTITKGADASITRDSLCAIHCGSLQIKNPSAAFITSVKVKLIGIHTDTENNQRPVTAMTTFSLQNIP